MQTNKDIQGLSDAAIQVAATNWYNDPNREPVDHQEAFALGAQHVRAILATRQAAPVAGQQGGDWKPTPEAINALPQPIRDYIHGIETIADPQYLVQQNTFLKDQCEGLQVLLVEARKAIAAHPPADAAPVEAKPVAIVSQINEVSHTAVIKVSASDGWHLDVKVGDLLCIAQPSAAQGDAVGQQAGDVYGTGIKPWSQRIPANQPANVICDAMQVELNELRAALAQRPTSAAPQGKWRGSIAQVICDVPLPKQGEKYLNGFVDAKEAILNALHGAGFGQPTSAADSEDAALVLEKAAQACDQQADGTNGAYRTACLQCANAVRELRDAARNKGAQKEVGHE